MNSSARIEEIISKSRQDQTAIFELEDGRVIYQGMLYEKHTWDLYIQISLAKKSDVKRALKLVNFFRRITFRKPIPVPENYR